MMENFKVIDYTGFSADQIASLLNQIWLGAHGDIPRYCYYCGITNDVEVRFRQHECEDWAVAEVLAVADCGTKDKAAKVEGLMRDSHHFDIGDCDNGGNGGCKDSIYVYLVRKGAEVNECSKAKDTLTEYLKNALDE